MGMKGSIPWMAPEMILSTGYTLPADIWSFGCTMIEMATGRRPWGKFDNVMTAMHMIGMSDESPPVPETLSACCQDFIASCLRREPMIRPTASELLLHELVCHLSDGVPERRST